MTSTPGTWPRIAVIGGGQMARALVGGWLARGAAAPSIAVADPAASQRDWLAATFPGLRLEADNAAAAAFGEVWLLAVKPQLLAEVARGLASLAAARRPLVVSIAAGVHTADIARWIGQGATVVRAMPNRPALVGAGATALYAAPAVPESARNTAHTLLEAVGNVVWVGSEAELDAVAAVSGSGPAYFFLLMELLEAAAIAEGLAPAVARRLALDTAAGAARLATTSTDDPATLRAQVTSKGGTTAAAVAVLEAADLRGIVARAVAAAARRSRELAAEFGRDRA
ncbi:MAG TPA: pyrroline-5-carboxylate reductase [Steroidobacteraceae bacterium]|nr:pyrroline-5-carboxylate reductase [Steroidobacteraceae bacterium]